MRKIIYILAVLIASLLISKLAGATDYNQQIRLEGKWSFKIGDDPDWSAAQFDDSGWTQIRVPSRWEEEGFQGYDGYAWFRKSVVIPPSFKDQKVILELGYIDDVDEVFFNGEKIGQTGSFPPHYSSAYNAFRKYEVPGRLIRTNGRNTIAVRVYDSGLEGGIIRGEIRIGAAGLIIVPDVDLSGKWDFSKGQKFNIASAKQILVPGQWENQGYDGYDGYAAYSRKVELTKQLADQRMIMLAGRIDDADELYINGQFIGSTGGYKTQETGWSHNEFRNYTIPAGILKPGNNVIEIRVYDSGSEGGILEGPIGLISQTKFIQYWKAKRIR
jgi:hypothetical protein